MHNYTRLVKGKRRDQLLMNPQDMRARQIEDGQQVTLSSRVGSLQVSCLASEEMMPGVVSLPHGWGHHRKGTRMQVAEAHAGVSCNDLTDSEALDFSGNAAVNGLPVEVAAA